jgi:hypothetical protein
MPSRWQVPPVMVIGEVNYPTENILQRKEKIQVNDFNSCNRSRSMTASSKRRIINYIVKKNSFVEPKQSDFSLELKYNKDCNIIVAELHNISNNNYNIIAEGAKMDFIEIHIICDSTELPSTTRPILSTISFPKNSCIKHELSLNNINFSGNCEIYAETAFYIINSDTLEKHKFKLISNSVNIVKNN